MEVLLAQGRGPIPKLICYLTNSKFSHSGLRYTAPEEDWLVHASIGGVQPDWWFHFRGHYPYIKAFKCTADVGDKALDLIIGDLAHTGYDYLGLIWQGLSIVLSKISVKLALTEPIKTPHKNKCSELLARWLNKCQELDPSLDFPSFDPEVFTPEDANQFCMSRPDLFSEIKV